MVAHGVVVKRNLIVRLFVNANARTKISFDDKSLAHAKITSFNDSKDSVNLIRISLCGRL